MRGIGRILLEGILVIVYVCHVSANAEAQICSLLRQCEAVGIGCCLISLVRVEKTLIKLLPPF